MENNKPTSLLIEEFKNNMFHTINDSGLPAFLLEYILKDMLNEIHDLAVDVTKREISEYNNSLKEQTEESASSIE